MGKLNGFEFYETANGHWRWRLKRNGENVGNSGQGFRTRDEAMLDADKAQVAAGAEVRAKSLGLFVCLALLLLALNFIA